MISLISLVALSLSFVDVSRPPAWQTDYRAALVQGARQHKPLAVFLAPGKESWHKLSPSGALSQGVQQLLTAKYVPVFLNTETAQGKAWASAFEVPGGIGLVLSDRDGQYQVFRHEGILPEKHLVGALERHAASRGNINSTEILVSVVHEAGSTSASVAPASYSPANSVLEAYAPTCLH